MGNVSLMWIEAPVFSESCRSTATPHISTRRARPRLYDFGRPEDYCAREHLRAARLERQSGNGVAAPKSAAGHGPAAFDRHAAETPFPAPSSSSRTQQFYGLYSVI